MNKAKAMQVLAIRLQNLQNSELNSEVDGERKSYPLFSKSTPWGDFLTSRRLERESDARRTERTIIPM